jgi:pimeloyl-ACP methyl ester carboxylesterase
VTGRDPVVVRHNKVDLALHSLADGAGRPLLLLHGLGERTPATIPDTVAAWPGPVWGLDFTGHGRSTIPVGGGYTAELLMADADHALAHLGPASLYGRGMGAYVALLLAGARPALVRGAILVDGPGLNGGGIRPGVLAVIAIDPAETGPPDPFALTEMARDVRPPDYAAGFARQAVERAGVEHALVVAAKGRPEWLSAVVGEFGVEVASIGEALAMVAGQAG